MAERTRVELPPGVGREFEVFLNGVRQVESRDFRREGGSLVFDRPLAREGRLGFWRWLSLFLGVAGTYRQNDTVDVAYEVGGRLQGLSRRRPPLARPAPRRLRDRAGDHGEGLPAAAPHLRAADRLLRAHVRRGEEDHVARRLQGARRARLGATRWPVSR